MTDNRAMELCRLAGQEGRPVDAYRYFLEISEDGILSDNFCCDGDYGGTVQYTDLLDCPALAGEENYNAYGEWNYAYPDRVMTLQEREDGLVLTFHGFGIHCRDNSRGVYGDEIDYDKGESLDMYVDSVFISAAEAEKNLVPCEDGGYAFFLLPAKGRYRYECRDLTARMEIGLLLKKDGNGWSIVSDEPQENDFYEKVWTKLEGFVLQNYPACDAELPWPDTLPESTARPEIQDFVRDLQNCIWLAAREKYRLRPDRWERLLEEHWEEWTGLICGAYDGIFDRVTEKSGESDLMMSRTVDPFWGDIIVPEKIEPSPQEAAMELCRLAGQEGRPVDAYRYFREASDDGIFYGYNIFPCTLFDEEKYPLYPDELCTLISGEDGLTLGFDPIRVMSSGWPNGVLKIDPIHIPQEQLKGEKVFLLLPIESSYYDEEILGRVDFHAEMGLLLEKTPEGWQIALLPEEDLHET